MSDLLSGLNPEQRRAAEHIDGPLLILAGAGSGKTRVLTHRIAWMLHKGVDPRSILAMTFTNKAAAEMKHRVAQLVGDRAKRILVSTFHSACVRFLRQDIHHLGYPRSFNIYDTDDQTRLFKEIARDMRLDSKQWSPARLRSEVDQAKNKLWTPDDLAADRSRDPGDPVASVYARYQAALVTAGAVDFNDLLGLVERLWREHPAVLERYQRRFRYLMVDEYQDTNRAQYALIRLLMKRPPGESQNVAVVGDDDQSIYAFRGADIRNILDFKKDFPGATVVRLEQNYRSTGNILAAAHGVVQHNPGRMDKQLWTAAGDGPRVRVIACDDEGAEAERVVGELRRRVQQGAARWGDFAVIYRTNAASRPFENVLVRAGVPHVLVGARKFYERREVRDLLSYLKLVLNPADELAWARIINVPRRGIGDKTVAGIRELGQQLGVPPLEATARWAAAGGGQARKAAARLCEQLAGWSEDAKTTSPGELVQRIAEQSGYAAALREEGTDEARSRLENVEALCRAAEEPFDDAELFDDLFVEAAAVDLEDPLVRLTLFLDRVSLAGQDEDLPDDDDHGKVTLLTAHLAKGLEFPVVYTVGMVEGGFPHFRALEREEDLEEERRLVYVAFTRAQQQLVVTRPRRRLFPGRGYESAQPSRFLGDIPPQVAEHEGSAFSGGGYGGSAFGGGGGYRSPHDAGLHARRAERAGYRPPAGLGGGSAGASRRTPSGPEGRAPFRSAAMAGGRGPLSTAEPDAELRLVTPEDPSELQPGTEVFHPQFGRGTIQERQGSPANMKLVIHFKGHGRKKLFLRHAHLEIVLP
ncbi:MAG: UvrD-helicase domain-containing protein [Alphaproteobacteria bacterium]|nr:UvrD-helicase domain-containing protein [Alphaproteobacteria bacterium]